jgi:hypothetical protein
MAELRVKTLIFWVWIECHPLGHMPDRAKEKDILLSSLLIFPFLQ